MNEVGEAIIEHLNTRLKPAYLAYKSCAEAATIIIDHRSETTDPDEIRDDLSVVENMPLNGTNLFIRHRSSPYELLGGGYTTRKECTIDFNDPSAFATLDRILQRYYKPSIETPERTDHDQTKKYNHPHTSP